MFQLGIGLNAVSAPVRGPIGLTGELVIATLDQRAHEQLEGQAKFAGIGAFARDTLTNIWSASDLPALALVVGDAIYAYSRGGVVVSLDCAGNERWRVIVPDDRSQKARDRGDRDSPFVADLVFMNSSIYLPAGAEVLQLASDSGQLMARAIAARTDRGVVARLVPTREDGLVTTCTERTGWDDEIYDRGSPLQPTSSLESRRTASGDLVAFDLRLKERWRLPPPVKGMMCGDRRPAVFEDGSIACVAARTVVGGGRHHLDLFRSQILLIDGSTGLIRWQRESESGLSQVNPVAVPAGVVANGLAFYALADGTLQWEVRSDQNGLDPTVTPIVDGERLLVVGRNGIRAIALHDGRLSDLVGFPQPFNGSVTTPLLRDGNMLYLGIEEGGAKQLLALLLPS